MEEREKEDLYIPTYVTAQHEYFPGFGVCDTIRPGRKRSCFCHFDCTGNFSRHFLCPSAPESKEISS